MRAAAAERYVVTLRDPRVDDAAPRERGFAGRVAAVEAFRDLLATMWRRPGAMLQLVEDGAVTAEFAHRNPERHHFNGLLVRQLAGRAAPAGAA